MVSLFKIQVIENRIWIVKHHESTVDTTLINQHLLEDKKYLKNGQYISSCVGGYIIFWASVKFPRPCLNIWRNIAW